MRAALWRWLWTREEYVSLRVVAQAVARQRLVDDKLELSPDWAVVGRIRRAGTLAQFYRGRKRA